MRSTNSEQESQPKERVISLKIPESLDETVAQAGKATGLSKANVFRLSIKRGVDVLLAQLLSQPAKHIDEVPVNEVAKDLISAATSKAGFNTPKTEVEP